MKSVFFFEFALFIHSKHILHSLERGQEKCDSKIISYFCFLPYYLIISFILVDIDIIVLKRYNRHDPFLNKMF